MEHPEHPQSQSAAAGVGLWSSHDDCFSFPLKVNVSSPTLQMMCPGVLQVNACHQQGEQQGLIRWTGEYRDCAIAKLVP